MPDDPFADEERQALSILKAIFTTAKIADPETIQRIITLNNMLCPGGELDAGWILQKALYQSI